MTKPYLRFPLRYFPGERALPASFSADSIRRRVVAFCAEEVRRQGDTPWHVFKMTEAWIYAQTMSDIRRGVSTRVNAEDILLLGQLTDEVNEGGYRDHDVVVGDYRAPAWELVSGLIADLIRRQDDLTPNEFYVEFEKIHPFGDGNGRVGKVLFNWKRGSLGNPVWPPDNFSTSEQRVENP